MRAKAVEGADLVDHVRHERRGLDVDEPTPEARQVAVAHVRADRHVGRDSPGADPAHDRGVAGVEAAGDVGTGDQLQQRVVIPHCPPAEALTEVGVEVDGGHAWSSISLPKSCRDDAKLCAEVATGRAEVT